VYKRMNSTETLIQRTSTEAPHQQYALHRAGCAQEGLQIPVASRAASENKPTSWSFANLRHIVIRCTMDIWS
jgi:hypothetical protein